tara:strand:- start:138 stop:524 length:387 start_codon:yes stop_codon:yes gene_type:complete
MCNEKFSEKKKTYNLTQEMGCAGLVGLPRVRLEEGYSQKELAQAIGVTQARISRAEIGKGKLSDEVLFKMSEVFGRRYDQLITDITVKKIGTTQILEEEKNIKKRKKKHKKKVKKKQIEVHVFFYKEE